MTRLNAIKTLQFSYLAGVALLSLLLASSLSFAQSKPDKRFMAVRIDQLDSTSAYGLLVTFRDSTITILDYEDLQTRHNIAYDQISRIVYYKKGDFHSGFLIGCGVAGLPTLVLAGLVISSDPTVGGYVIAFGALFTLGGILGGSISVLSKISIYQEVNGDLDLFQDRPRRLRKFQMKKDFSIRKTKRGAKNIDKLRSME